MIKKIFGTFVIVLLGVSVSNAFAQSAAASRTSSRPAYRPPSGVAENIELPDALMENPDSHASLSDFDVGKNKNFIILEGRLLFGNTPGKMVYKLDKENKIITVSYFANNILLFPADVYSAGDNKHKMALTFMWRTTFVGANANEKSPIYPAQMKVANDLNRIYKELYSESL